MAGSKFFLLAAAFAYFSVRLPAQGTGEMRLSGAQQGNEIQLKWNGSLPAGGYYLIQKKIDQQYYTIDSVKPSASSQQVFSYTESYAAAGVNVYRVKKAGCSKIAQVSNEYPVHFLQKDRFTLAGSPGSKLITAFHGVAGTQDDIIVLNAGHKKVANIRVKPQKAFTMIDLAGLANGLYHVGWKSGNSFIYQPYVLQ